MSVQCGRKVRGVLQAERRHLQPRRGAVDSAGHLQELVYDRRAVLPVRPAGVQDEVRLLDVQRRPGQSLAH